MKILLASIVLIILGIFLIPQASAVPYSYNTTAISLPFTTTLKNSSSYDVFTNNAAQIGSEIKWNNDTVDSVSGATGAITYRSTLVDFWKMDNVLTDSKNVTNTLVKIAGTTSYDGGIENQALGFNGATYFQPTGPYGAFNNDGTKSFSVSFWYKVKSSNGTSYEVILSKDDPTIGTGGPGWGIVDEAQTGTTMDFIMGSDSTHLIRVRIGTGNYADNNYHHIVWTYSGSKTAAGVKLYIDGTLQTLSTVADTMGATSSSNSKAFTVGAEPAGTRILGTGTRADIDELRYYNNVVLSSDDVKGLYMVGKYKQSHEFDGGEIVSFGNVFNTERTDQWTYSGWLKTTLSGKVFWSKLSGATGSYLQISGNNVDLIRKDGTHTEETHGSTNVADGNWHHIVVENSGTGRAGGISMWVDKNPETMTIVSDTLTASIINAGNLQFGDINGGGQALSGQLDDTYLMNLDLTQAQINSIYNAEGFTITSNPGTSTTAWYHGASGSSTLTRVLGVGLSSLTLQCSLGTANADSIQGNGTFIYYMCPTGGPYPLYQMNLNTGTSTVIMHVPVTGGTSTNVDVLVGKKSIIGIHYVSGGSNSDISIQNVGNITGTGSAGTKILTNQRISIGTSTYKYYYNGTSATATTGTGCELLYQPTNATRTVDNIACDQSFYPKAIRYWQGMLIQGQSLYYTNSTQNFLNSVDAETYKHLLTLPCVILGISDPCVTQTLTDGNGVVWFIATDGNKFYYNTASYLNSLINQNRAWQSYDMINPTTTSSYGVLVPGTLQFKLYGFTLNSTVAARTGLFSIPSGYNFKPMTSETNVRNIDPRWTADNTDIPTIFTGNTVFQIALTVSNAPTDAAIKVTNGGVSINGQETVYAVSQLDATRSVELDLPPGVCANTYVADISVIPVVYSYQGQLCATGTSVKTIAYTSSLPTTFYTLTYGATSSYNPANNGLTTTVRSTTSPFTYTATIKNSTGATTQVYTRTINGTIDSHVFNVTNATKPAALYISVPGKGNIYSAYLGSSLSLASVASFFHQYLSYQGFDLLSFLPIVFAAMFTRNTVGIGIVMTVVVIASISWLSIVVIPDQAVYLSIVVAIIACIGYRIAF